MDANVIHVPGFGYASVGAHLPDGYVRLDATFASRMTLYRKRESIPALAALPIPDEAESIDPVPDVSPVIDTPVIDTPVIIPAPEETEQFVPSVVVPAGDVVVLDPPIVIIGLDDEPPVPDDATEPIPLCIVAQESVPVTLNDLLAENTRLKARVAELEAVVAQQETRLAHPVFTPNGAPVSAADNPYAALLKNQTATAEDISRAGDLQAQAVFFNALKRRGLVI